MIPRSMAIAGRLFMTSAMRTWTRNLPWTFLQPLPGMGGRWSWRSGPAGSRSRWRPGASPWRVWTPRRRWWSNCEPSQEANRYRSPSATWLMCRSAAGSGWSTWYSTPCSGCSARRGQAQGFANVARVLEPDGVFVVECFVPDLARFDRDQRVQTRALTEDSAILELSRHDAA